MSTPTTVERLQTAADLLQPWTQESANPEDNRLDVWLAADQLVPAVEALHGARWGYLAAITGLDDGPEAGTLQALYHFGGGAAVTTLRVRIPRDAATLPSICAEIPSATFFERELSEMFGITITDTPNPDRLFLPEDWPDGVYPLRKDFTMAAAPLPGKEAQA
jgi:Ni,Fe-hydrogenase III component G